MNIQKRLFRRPFTTVIWLILLIAMTLFIVVGGALYFSSSNVAAILDAQHTTIAVRTDTTITRTPTETGNRVSFSQNHLTQADVDFLEGLESVEGVYFHTLTGAYSPSFSPVLGLSKYFSWDMYVERIDGINESYDDVLLVGELVKYEISLREDTVDLSRLGLGKEEPQATIIAHMKVKERLSAHPDYFSGEYGSEELTDVMLLLSIWGQEGLDMIEVGKQYLIAGQYDSEWFSNIDYEDYHYPQVKCDHILLPKDGALWNVGSFRTDSAHDNIVLSAPFLSLMMTELVGSAEDFLADPANSQWAEIADSYDKAQHSLPVLGTDNLETMYLFFNNKASVDQGRTFTQEEYDTGAKVCILNQTMADKAGISVGDTISISQFICHDFEDTSHLSNLSLDSTLDGILNNPTIGKFKADTEFVTENEEFTVIGLYRLENEWQSSSYAITPNTVFIPKKAQIDGGFGGVSSGYSAFTNGAHGVYLSLKLRNGMVTKFEEEISTSKLNGTFIPLDHGYDAVQRTANDVVESAEKLFLIAAVGWFLLLMLYVLLYQGFQRKNLGIMRALGAKPGQARRYLFGSGGLLAAIGVAVGVGISRFILGVVQEKLLNTPLTEARRSFHSAMGAMGVSSDALNIMLEHSQLSTEQLLLLGVVQIAVIGAVLWIHAAIISRQKPRRLLRG